MRVKIKIAAVMILGSLYFSQAGLAQDLPLVIEGKPLQVSEPDTVALSVHPMIGDFDDLGIDPVIPIPKWQTLPPDIVQRPKLKFKEKHPSVYKAYRKSRHACIMFLPFLSVTAQVAQIITPILL